METPRGIPPNIGPGRLPSAGSQGRGGNLVLSYGMVPPKEIQAAVGAVISLAKYRELLRTVVGAVLTSHN